MADNSTLYDRLPNGKQMFAPVISTELELQLEQWHSHLPGFLRFDRYSISESNINPQLLFLRTQYYVQGANSVTGSPSGCGRREALRQNALIILFCLDVYQDYNFFVLSAYRTHENFMPGMPIIFCNLVLHAKNQPSYT